MTLNSHLKYLSWQQFEKKMEATQLAIIPAGAIEANGPHLPLGLDTIVSEKLAELVAEKVNAIVGPTLEAGDSPRLDDFPGTIVIRPESFKLYLEDVCQSLIKWGVKDFLFINGHGRNVPIITQLADSLQRTDEIRCAQVNVWQFMKQNGKDKLESGEIAYAHGGEAASSVMLYLAPELVDVDHSVNEPLAYVDSFPDIMTYPKISEMTKSSTIGNATLGTEEKGKMLVQMLVDRIIEFLKEEWKV